MGAEEAERCGLAEIEGQSLQSTIRRGWYWGTEAFREKMVAFAGREKKRASNRNYASSPQGKDHARARAERILVKGATHFRLGSPESVRELGRGDRRRVAIAWALWRKTAMPQRWIAQHTGLWTAANVSQQVRRYGQVPARKLPAKERKWKEGYLKFDD